MDTKPLYVLVADGGDGSYNPKFTLDAAWIDRQEDLYEAGELEYDAVGVDGDGFHYTVIQVPSDATYESLGINKYLIVGD
jgi:hypothetical protein